MENKTIQEILQKKLISGFFAKDRFLYSPLLGKCILQSANNDIFIERQKPNRPNVIDTLDLRPDGMFSDDGECMVYPSAEMRDWSKFAWEKYTLLEKSRSKRVFFEKWASPDYTRFIGVDFVLEEGSAKVRRGTYRTSYFHSVAEEECEAFYKSLFYYSGEKSLSFLAESIPLYKEVTDKLIRGVQKSDEQIGESREALEALTRKAILADKAKNFELVKGKLYYFKNADMKGVSYIAKFLKLSDDKKVAFFDWTVVCQEYIYSCRLGLGIKTDRCVGFRRANDEEENRFKRVFNDFRNSLVSFVVGQYYTFIVEDGFTYFGKLVSFKENKSDFTLSDVYCAHRGNKPQYFEEKKFITSQCENLRIAADSDKYFFDGVKASYNESRKDSHQLKPKDWCLMRYDDDAPWELCQYAYNDSNEADGNMFVAVGGSSYRYCISYEGNEQLLGTIKSPDDGK